MNLNKLFLLICLGVALSACFDNDHPPDGSADLAAEVQAPLDKASSVNQMIDDQDAAQRKRMDAQGQ